jgi:hypothetical protein
MNVFAQPVTQPVLDRLQIPGHWGAYTRARSEERIDDNNLATKQISEKPFRAAILVRQQDVTEVPGRNFFGAWFPIEWLTFVGRLTESGRRTGKYECTDDGRG